MHKYTGRKALAALMILTILLLTSCSATGPKPDTAVPTTSAAVDYSRYLTFVEDEPDTLDFQCTTLHYTVALNVFDRLAEMEQDAEGQTRVVPSLAERWEISEDSLRYTFHLRPGVKFSNGCELTAEDVQYTLERMLTLSDSRSKEIALEIAGAEQLAAGRTDRLAGFIRESDLDFTIVLDEPFPGFLAILTTPAASILDQETVLEAGARFGKEAEWTVGTGSFILREWDKGKDMTLDANRDCWKGAPGCDGLRIRYLTDAADLRMYFEDGELDILNLDGMGDDAEYFYHGDIYQEHLYQVPHVDLAYIALNASINPLDDVRVRKALQLGLNRQVLLDAAYAGRGQLENGIFPHGLEGFNPDAEDLGYDPEKAKELLAEAGYADGFDLPVTVRAAAGANQRQMMEMAASMWKKIGVRATVTVIDETEYMNKRGRGALACYTGTWAADYNDPDNFIYTFFGSAENTKYRSLYYADEDVMARVRAARTIQDREERIREYRALEKRIVAEDAAWIPLFSRTYGYVTADRVKNFTTDWNGWYTPNLMNFTLEE